MKNMQVKIGEAKPSNRTDLTKEAGKSGSWLRQDDEVALLPTRR